MKKYLIWETEYPDEGNCLFEAEDEDDAVRQWLAETGVHPDNAPDFDVQEATPAILEVHEASAAVQEAEGRLARALSALRDEMEVVQKAAPQN
jgi:hypothetical protein